MIKRRQSLFECMDEGAGASPGGQAGRREKTITPELRCIIHYREGDAYVEHDFG